MSARSQLSRAARRRQRVMGIEDAANRKCQKCLKTDHWTYECKLEGSVYKHKTAATQQLKQFSYVEIIC